MLLAIVYHVRRREPPAAPAILFALVGFVALGVLLTGVNKSRMKASSDRW